MTELESGVGRETHREQEEDMNALERNSRPVQSSLLLEGFCKLVPSPRGVSVLGASAEDLLSCSCSGQSVRRAWWPRSFHLCWF